MSQAGKQLALLGGLLVVAAGLGAFAYFGVHQPDTKAAEKKDHDERLFAAEGPGERAPDGGAARAEFTRLVISARGENTTLERVPGGEWRLTAPVKAKADKLVLDGVVSQLQTARFKATLDENPDVPTLAKYGLDVPRFTVEAEAKVGDALTPRTVKLEGGIENTFDGSIFMRRGGDPAVHSAPGGVRFSLEKTTFELRDKKLFDFDPEQVKTFAARGPVNSWTIQRKDDGAWAFSTGELVDGPTFLGLCNALKGLSASSFPDDTPAQRAAMGVQAPAGQISITFKNGEALTLSVGRPGGDAGVKYYGLREAGEGALLGEVDAQALSFDRNPMDLRDHTLLPVKKELVTRLTLHPADGPDLVLEKESLDAGAEAWRMTAPRPGPIKVFKVTGALWTVTSLKAGKVAEPDLSRAAKFGLTEKSRWIALGGADGRELGRVVLGGPVPGNKEAVYARGLENQVVELDATRLTDLPWKLEDLVDAPPPSVPDAGSGGR